jgi:hypothetical protein
MTYTGSLESPPIVIRQARGKLVRILLLSIVMTALVVFAWRGMRADGDPKAPLMLAGACFFALGIPLFSYQLVRPATLTLTPQGFSYHGIGKGWSRAWSDIAGFGLLEQRSRGIKTSSMLCWTYQPHYDSQKVGRQVASFVSGGAEGALPGMWSLKPEALLELMEQARLRWAGGAKADEDQLI